MKITKKALTKKELKKVAAEVIPILPPAFEEKKELLEQLSGIEMQARDPKGTYNPKKIYRKYKPSIVQVNYAEKMKAHNKSGGQSAVFGMFLFYCNKACKIVSAMNTVQKGRLENMKLVNYVNDPNFKEIMLEFSRIAKGELLYKDSRL